MPNSIESLKVLGLGTFGLADGGNLGLSGSGLDPESEGGLVFGELGLGGLLNASAVKVEEGGLVARGRALVLAVVGASVVAVAPLAVDGNAVLVDLVGAPPVKDLQDPVVKNNRKIASIP